MLYPGVMLVADDYVDLRNAAIAVGLSGGCKNGKTVHTRDCNPQVSHEVCKTCNVGAQQFQDMAIVEQRQQRLRSSLINTFCLKMCWDWNGDLRPRTCVLAGAESSTFTEVFSVGLTHHLFTQHS